MQIKPNSNLLLIRKHKNTKLKADISISEDDGDKRLITGEVLSEGDAIYGKGETVIFGKYALLRLTVQGEDYYFIDKEDIIGVCDYTEN